MWKKLRPQLPSRLHFALVGCMACLLLAGAFELLFAAVNMQGRLADQSARSLLFELGEVQRSTRDRLKTGDIQITLRWHNRNDLDLSCQDPSGEQVFYNHLRANSGGELDLDMNANAMNRSSDPVENIHWPWNSAPKGHYRVFVKYYQRHEPADPTEFEGTILVEGQAKPFHGVLAYGSRAPLAFDFDVTHAPRSFFGIHPGLLYAAFVVGSWFGLISALLATALIGAENLWYRRHYKKPILTVVVAARRVGIAFAIAFGYSAVCQLVFGVLANRLGQAAIPNFIAQNLIVLVRLVCWTICFTVIGARLGRLVPNVARKTAFLVSLAVGWIAGVVFLLGAAGQIEVLARLFGAGLFGFTFGFLICLIWDEAAAPVQTTPALSLPPMRLQPYRMTVNQFESVGRKTPEATGADRKAPAVPHEKPV